MTLFAEISFPAPLGEESFTYQCGEAIGRPRPGARAEVILMNRKTIGYVLEVHERQPAFKTRPIIRLIDRTSLFSPAMFELGLWMAKNCLCSSGEALHAMLPAGIKCRGEKRVIPMDKLLVAAPEVRLHEALLWLKTHGPVSFRSFRGKFPVHSSLIVGWETEGWLTTADFITENAKPKLIRVLSPVHERLKDDEGLTPKEKLVIEYLLRKNAPATQAQICRESGVSGAPVLQLLKKGILEARTERVFRELTGDNYYRMPEPKIPQLTSEQISVLETVRRSFGGDGKPVLIRGVTCSGKTEIYLRWVAEVLAKGRGAIVLVPEISLTPQTIKRFRDRFGDEVAILHSKLSDGERFDQWESIRCGAKQVVVGARSAIFAPMKNLGTVIMDEEGEPTFKQSDTPRYHTREVALKRCELENALLIMGSATPTLDAFSKAVDGQYILAELTERVGQKHQPEVEIVDMRREITVKHNRSMFSRVLQKELANVLTKGKQAILYLNRRGHSSFVMCRECGQAIECSRCKISLVYHSGSDILRCHYCGEFKPIPKLCPACKSNAIRFFGAGTQRIESEARRYFPRARIERMDSDTVGTKGSIESILKRFGNREIDILIGTQMVAKGLDFPEVTLVGILAADALLRLPDFRAAERNFALLAQVAGRAGRGDSPGKVVLQTYFPEHHSIVHALTEDYRGFYEEEISKRKDSGFPPFTHLTSFMISGENREKCVEACERLLAELLDCGVFERSRILGPAPAPIEVINNRYRFQLLLKHSDPKEMTTHTWPIVRRFRIHGIRLAADADPHFVL